MIHFVFKGRNMFARNLKAIMNGKNITAQFIADRLGVTRGTVTNWSNGERFPKNEQLIQGLASILQTSVAELFGEKSKQSILPSSVEMINYVDLRAGAGAEGVLGDTISYEKIPISKQFLNGIDPRNLEILKVVGDSMATTINPDEFVIIDKANGREFYLVDGIYLISKDGAIQIKRLHFKGDKGIDIISDNKAYPKENTVEDNIDVQIIGKLFKQIKNLGALAIRD